ncbi:hypothetical protein [Glaciihabitans sp. dw_435]|uniref:hypothetical protein n=1 Tax=Glaciihabitans sp. dw_435 TaxID=2720081 RepID=UPI001BD5101D|nr:hypothetical protein [Glaciihabitans sp. dw_435]
MTTAVQRRMRVEQERSWAPWLIIFGAVYSALWIVFLITERFTWWRVASVVVGLAFIARGIYGYVRARRYYAEEDARVAHESGTSAPQ